MKRLGAARAIAMRAFSVRGTAVLAAPVRVAAMLLLAVAWAVATAVPAAAEEQPSILKAYGLDWIERVREDAWPQPKEQRPVICLLDTGVAVTPDTPADDPLGPIVARLALDGGTGLPQGTQPEHLHGTQMASVIAAPRNGYGTVGVFPQARIVSIRVTEGDATYITPPAVEAGVRVCRSWVLARGLTIGSVVMAESGYDQRDSDSPRWEKAASLAAQSHGAFIAAAGNWPGASPIPPASVASAIVIAAGDDAGQFCSFASTNASRLLVGPGCSTEVANGQWAWPAGSSAATASAGALVAAFGTVNPMSSAEERVTAVFSMSTKERRLDGTALRASFAGLVDPPADTPVATPIAVPARGVAGVTNEPPGTAIRQELWRPTARAVWRSGTLRVLRRDRRLRGVMRVVLVSRDGQAQQRTVKGRTARWKLPRRPARLEVWAEDSSASSTWRSLTRRVKVET